VLAGGGATQGLLHLQRGEMVGGMVAEAASGEVDMGAEVKVAVAEAVTVVGAQNRVEMRAQVRGEHRLGSLSQIS